MHRLRPAFALDPRSFGRRGVACPDEEIERPAIAEDVRLFATSFAVGFLFVSVLIF